MDQASNHEHAFANWKERTSEHTARARLDADIFVHDILQGAYPDHYLVRTSPDKSDLLGYAKAGHATAIRNASSGYDATRVYRAPRPRLESSGRLASGKLDDVVNFAVWDYEWRDIDFIVYETAYRNRFMQNVKTLYVLAPQVACTEDAYGCNKQIDSLLLASGEWTSELHEQIWIFDNSQWQKDKLLWRGVQDASWDDVILDSAVKPQLNQDVHGFFDSQALYQRAKIPWKRGIIFHGVPGNGKTLSIKALINSLAARSIPSLYVKNLDACSGPKWSIQKIFQQARRAAPCLLILEDLDSLVGDTTRSYFLNEVDGLESNDGILMIGSTNHLDRLDPAVTKRPSRFDRKYHFKVPTESERLAYCRYWRDKSSDFPDELCPLIASWTEGFSFAYLKELFVTALLIHTTTGNSSMSNGEATNGTDSHAVHSDEKAMLSTEVNENAIQSVPDVEVPEPLRGNALLHVFHSQAQALREEMDHATNEVAVPKTSSGPNPIQFRIPDPLDDDED